MKKKIKEVQNYFKSKIIDGDFEIKKISEHTLIILIDSEYEFTMWIANGVNWYEDYRNTAESCFIHLPKFTQAERKKAWSKVYKQINSFKSNVLLAEKRKQLAKLKKELGVL